MEFSHRIIASESDLDDPGLRSVFHQWDMARGRRIGPPQIDLLSIPSMVNDCLVFAIPDGDGPEAAVVTFAGTGRIRALGHELTGRRLGDLGEFPRGQALVLDTAERGKPLVEGPFRPIEEGHSYQLLVQIGLPLSADGAGVSGIVWAGHFKSALR